MDQNNQAPFILDGEPTTFTPGETVYEIATRLGKFVPTLCYDPRLQPFGACRLCVVEQKGSKNPVASCTTKAAPGMEITTSSERVEKFRKTLLEMVASENPIIDVVKRCWKWWLRKTRSSMSARCAAIRRKS